MKRTDYISWDEYFMGIAMLAARRSKDPNTQVGACIVSQDNIIISTGYNGMPKGCSDDEYPWERVGEDTKYPYVVHAELNAVLNASGRDLRGSKLYVALFPCNECAKAIIQSGVKEVYYLSDKYADSMATLASKRMLMSAGVKFTQLKTNLESIIRLEANVAMESAYLSDRYSTSCTPLWMMALAHSLQWNSAT